MTWIDQHPDDLIERSEPTQALEWLRESPVLDAAALGKLDLFLHHWVLLVLQRPADVQGVLELISLCQVAGTRAASSSGAESMSQRWKAFEDLLEAKRLALRAAQAVQTAPAAPLRHEATIREFIERQPDRQATQATLAEHLGLSAGRVSQILGVLESRGLVTRQRRGQENWVRWVTQPGAATPAGAQPTTPTATPAGGEASHLGAQVFRLRRNELAA